MKNIFKKSAYLLFALLTINSLSATGNTCKAMHIWPFSNSSQSQNETSETFDFIKSNDKKDGFFNTNNMLFYGGISLITISVLGIIITLKPKKRKNKHRKSKRNNDNRPSANR